MTLRDRQFRRVVLAACVLAFAGCSLPQWRIFEKKVPTNIEKPKAQVEGEKRAASYVLKRSSPLATKFPTMDELLVALRQQLADIHDVSAGLSASLGEPEKPVSVEDKDGVIRDLRAANMAKDKQLAGYKDFFRKHGGETIEGTGINLAGPAGVAVLVGIIALCVACPPIGWALLRALPLLWGFFRRTTWAISEYVAANPDAGKNLKVILGDKMDAAHKLLVKRHAKPAPIPASSPA